MVFPPLLKGASVARKAQSLNGELDTQVQENRGSTAPGSPENAIVSVQGRDVYADGPIDTQTVFVNPGISTEVSTIVESITQGEYSTSALSEFPNVLKSLGLCLIAAESEAGASIMQYNNSSLYRTSL